MLKKFSALAMLLGMTLFVVGCEPAAETTDTTETPAADAAPADTAAGDAGSTETP